MIRKAMYIKGSVEDFRAPSKVGDNDELELRSAQVGRFGGRLCDFRSGRALYVLHVVLLSGGEIQVVLREQTILSAQTSKNEPSEQLPKKIRIIKSSARMSHHYA